MKFNIKNLSEPWPRNQNNIQTKRSSGNPGQGTRITYNRKEPHGTLAKEPE
jgi:hypothetical protein